MKKLLLLLVAAAFAACGQNPAGKTGKTVETAELAAMVNGVEVLSFHTSKRCPTCVAIEKLTREVVETDFAAQLADGTLRLRVLDISENEALADRFEVTWSSLLVNRYAQGEQSVNNLTKFAFANARTNPAKFKAELKSEIEKQLAR